MKEEDEEEGRGGASGWKEERGKGLGKERETGNEMREEGSERE